MYLKDLLNLNNNINFFYNAYLFNPDFTDN